MSPWRVEPPLRPQRTASAPPRPPSLGPGRGSEGLLARLSSRAGRPSSSSAWDPPVAGLPGLGLARSVLGNPSSGRR